MSIPNRFELRKKLFDFLATKLAATADVVVEHPLAIVNKSVVVVTPVRNQAAGRLLETTAVNPEIQLTSYGIKELDLTKPTGLLRNIEVLMQEFLRSPASTQMPEFSNGFLVRTVDAQYVSRLKLYSAFSIYRFYLGSVR